jgi:hypothetical protein
MEANYCVISHPLSLCQGGEEIFVFWNPYTSQRRIWHLCSRRHDEEQPRLRVQGRLLDLIPLEMMILDALPIGGHPLHGDGALTLVQEFGGRRQVRQHNQRPDARHDGDRTKDDEDVHPPGQTGGDMADGVADQSVLSFQ